MTANDGVSTGEQMLALLHKQRDIFVELDRLSKRQQTLVIEDDAQPLLDLLADRQRLVDRLVRLNHQMTPYRRRWPEISSTLSEEDRQAAKALLDQVREMLGGIMAADERDSRLLATRKDALAERLTSRRLGQRANQAYQSTATEPQYLDTTDTNA